MRKLFSLFLAVLLVFSLAMAQAEQDNFLISDWKLQYTYDETLIAEQTIFIYEDKTFEVMDEDQSNKGTWTFDDGTLVLTADNEALTLVWDEAEHRFTGDYNGMKLIMAMSIQPENGSQTGGEPEATAEGTTKQDDAAGMEMFMQMMKAIPGMDQIDWEGFMKDFAEKKASGAEITLEDCLPAGAWALFGSMQFMDEKGQVPEDLPMTVEVTVTGNEMVSLYILKEQADEANAKTIAESIAASFETPEAMQNLKNSIEQMAGAGIDTGKVVMTLRFLNADQTVIYEKTYTYDELTKALEPAA